MVLKLRNSGGGIGDQVCGLYVCQALKEKHISATVEYYTKYPEWLIELHDIVIKPYSHYFISPPANIDLYIDSSSRKYYAKKKWSRKEIYADRLGITNVKLVRPELKKNYSFKNSYILLFPFAAWKDREWKLDKWLLLENMLEAEGFKTMVCGQGNRKAEIDLFSGEKAIECKPKEVIDRMLNASLVVANDSGMAHVAGMYGVPTVAILSGQFDTTHLFSETDVSGVLPAKQKCSDCKIIRRRNVASNCRNGCEALNSIEPKTVFDEILRLFFHQIEMSELFGTIELV
jgi:heptosyltransferase-1